MSSSGSPFDPFRRSERTIVRPDPGGRQAAALAAPPSYAREPPVATPAPPASSGEEWVAPQEPVSPFEPPRERQRAIILRREELITPNVNPLMRAASPLLLVLGRLRAGLLQAPASQLIEQVADAIEEFEHEVRAAGLTPEQTRVAKYILCATADDIVQNIPGDERHIWTQYSMLSRYFGERIGGVNFFKELERHRTDPSVNYDLLELQHACLALGFQGIHRTSAGGMAALQQIQRDLYETLRRVKRPTPDLSPRWQGQDIAIQNKRSPVPAWALASVTAALLLAFYLVLRTLLGGESDAAASSIIGVHPAGQIGIQRRVFQTPPPPPPPTPQITRIRTALSPPLTVLEKGNTIVIQMANLTLFAPGDATVRDEFKPLIAKVATVLEKEPGAVKVVGHTDSAPIRSVRFPSNFHLSQERAKAVASLVQAGLTKPNRIESEGKGADIPIATNDTPAGRAQNRRVEILLQRSQ